MLVFIIHLVFAFWHRTTDNQWSTRIVNQHRVHLIHDSVVVTALHEIHWAGSHIVAQVVKTELIIGTKCNIACVCTTTFIGVRFVFVDTIHSQTMEHIERAHPLGVTFGEVVVDGYHVYTFVGQSIEEHRQRSHKGFTLTRSHLGNLAFVKNHTTYELHIIVHHIPYVLVATCGPFVKVNGFVAVYLHKVESAIGSQVAVHLCRCYFYFLVLSKAASGTLDNGEYLRKNLTKHVLVGGLDIFFDMVYFVVNFLTFVYFEIFDIGF